MKSHETNNIHQTQGTFMLWHKSDIATVASHMIQYGGLNAAHVKIFSQPIDPMLKEFWPETVSI